MFQLSPSQPPGTQKNNTSPMHHKPSETTPQREREREREGERGREGGRKREREREREREEGGRGAWGGWTQVPTLYRTSATANRRKTKTATVLEFRGLEIWGCPKSKGEVMPGGFLMGTHKEAFLLVFVNDHWPFHSNKTTGSRSIIG